MAVSTGSQFSLFDVQWSSQVAAFSNDNHGKNIQLTEQETLASRNGGITDWGHGLVCTKKPVEVGKMFKVTVLRKHAMISFGGLGLGFTTDNSNLHSSLDIMRAHFPDKSGFIYLDSDKLKHKEHVSSLDFSTYHLKVGQTVGVLLTKKGDIHWFVGDVWRGCARLNGFPLDKEIWGLIDVCARCTCVKAEIAYVSGYNKAHKEQLVLMGLITDGPATDQATAVHQEPSEGRLNQLQQDIMKRIRDEIAAQTEQLRHQLSQEQRVVQALRQENDNLKQEIEIVKSVASPSEQELWQVSLKELTIREDEVLGRGGWGYVAKGLFRGTPVAVKRVYPEIFQQTTLKRIRREINTMAQIRHPNLVLFIAAVLDERTGPIILTELLDTSLRVAYEKDRIGSNKRKIFIDVASALVYLHEQREPVIHRDVSTANVLLVALPHDTWLAKLSDFGSANLARDATTPGEGAIVYTAPEAFPQHPSSPQPPPKQTTKIDVYSFGVLVCEVTTRVFPSSSNLRGLMDALCHSWPQIHPLTSTCVSYAPENRPTMSSVLKDMKELTAEP